MLTLCPSVVQGGKIGGIFTQRKHFHEKYVMNVSLLHQQLISFIWNLITSIKKKKLCNTFQCCFQKNCYAMLQTIFATILALHKLTVISISRLTCLLNSSEMAISRYLITVIHYRASIGDCCSPPKELNTSERVRSLLNRTKRLHKGRPPFRGAPL